VPPQKLIAKPTCKRDLGESLVAREEKERKVKLITVAELRGEVHLITLQRGLRKARYRKKHFFTVVRSKDRGEGRRGAHSIWITSGET